MTEDKAYYTSQITSSVDYNTFAMCDDVSSSFSNYYNTNYGVAKDYGGLSFFLNILTGESKNTTWMRQL